MIDRLELKNFNCPAQSTYLIRGQYIDDPFISIYVVVKKCDQKGQIKCVNEIEINRLIEKLEV